MSSGVLRPLWCVPVVFQQNPVDLLGNESLLLLFEMPSATEKPAARDSSGFRVLKGLPPCCVGMVFLIPAEPHHNPRAD
jgi:hypothetical protein